MTPQERLTSVEMELNRLIALELISPNRVRFEQHLFYRELWNNFDTVDKAMVYARYKSTMDDAEIDIEKGKDEVHFLEDPTKQHVQDFILLYKIQEINVTLSIEELHRIRYHNKTAVLVNAIDNAKSTVMWHQQNRHGSQYNGHWYIEINDVKIIPVKGESLSLDTPINIERYRIKVPMGNCPECMATGKLRETCMICDMHYATLNFHDDQNPTTDRTGIVHPHELSMLLNEKVYIPIILDRYNTPNRWTPVVFKNIGAFIEDKFLDLDQDRDPDLKEIARVTKFPLRTIQRKFNRRLARIFNDPTDDTTDDNASETDPDKNTIG